MRSVDDPGRLQDYDFTLSYWHELMQGGRVITEENGGRFRSVSEGRMRSLTEVTECGL